MKKLSNTEVELKKSVAYKKSVCICFLGLIHFIQNGYILNYYFILL